MFNGTDIDQKIPVYSISFLPFFHALLLIPKKLILVFSKYVMEMQSELQGKKWALAFTCRKLFMKLTVILYNFFIVKLTFFSHLDSILDEWSCYGLKNPVFHRANCGKAGYSLHNWYSFLLSSSLYVSLYALLWFANWGTPNF